jgi:DNA polymerase III epsilon subunit-like protein
MARLRRIVLGGRWVAFDTETTDLGPRAELVELAIVEPDGRVFETLVRPSGSVSPAAARVHRIDPEALAVAPPFSEVAAQVRQRLARRTVLAYHTDFDRRVLWRAFAGVGEPAPRCRWHCVCDFVTQWVGQRLPLEQALGRVGLEVEHPRHRAATDARGVAALAKALAALDSEGGG